MTALQHRITIVSGLPRSGTSMCMRMLEAGGMPLLTDNVRQADEDNPEGYYEYEPVKRTRDDASWLELARGKAVKMVYLLLYDLPAGYQYHVIFMQRDLDEVLASQQIMLDRRGEPSGGADFEQLFRRQLAKFDAWIKAQQNFSVLNVSYNQALVDPHAIAAEINSFLGDWLDTQAMAETVNPSLYRNRRSTA